MQAAGQGGHDFCTRIIIHIAPVADFIERTAAAEAMAGKRGVFRSNGADAGAGGEDFRYVHGRHIGCSRGEGKGGEHGCRRDLLGGADRIAGMAAEFFIGHAGEGEGGQNRECQSEQDGAEMIAWQKQ